jgi:hypothetical protein
MSGPWLLHPVSIFHSFFSVGFAAFAERSQKVVPSLYVFDMQILRDEAFTVEQNRKSVWQQKNNQC